MTLIKNVFSKSFKFMRKFKWTQYFVTNSGSVSHVDLSSASYDTHVPESGTLAPIVIMHGLFGSKANWNTLAKALNQRTKRRVITVDARNHGDSPHSPIMTYPALADDVNALLKYLKVENSVLIGHSMGGAAMMATALKYPKIVEKLLIVDMSPVKTSPSLHQMTEIIDTMLTVTFENSRTLSEARKRTDEILAKAIDSPSLRQFLLMNVVETNPGKFQWRVNLPVIAENFASQIAVFPSIVSQLGKKNFDGPTLFIAGSNSDYIKHEDHLAIKNIFPTAEFKYISGAGHWVQSDKPAEFINAATEFIND